ncbi:hypothetical protein BPAE_0071g00400 [Botrytis paeoniae]|uniref:Uncharacterized protein n=1 Tax=Botrytis paeoniae TaxID=278948 RepID=A0A4Z1FQM6_9HELO|nr:hypothetical protein BPAE_0071g00400 [Botrytis paeoniae]
MSPFNLVLRTAFILSSISNSFAAVCNDQTRASGDPSGEKLTALLDSQDQISQFCSVHVSGKTSGSVSFSDFKISFERSDISNSTLEHCTEALQDIISQCIEPSDQGMYGGSSTFENGETYTISNDLYPQAPTVSVNLENRAVEDAAKARTHKTTIKLTTKTTKTTPKTTVAQATTSPKTTAITPKPTPTSVTTSPKTTQITPTTSKPSTTKTSLSSETPKTTVTSTSSEITQTIPTTSKSSMSTIKTSVASETPKTTPVATTSKSLVTTSTTSQSLTANTNPSSATPKSTISQSTESVPTTSEFTISSIIPSSQISTKESGTSTSTTSIPTITPGTSTSSKPSLSNIPPSLSTTKPSTSSLEISSHIPESASTPSQSTSTKSVSVETSLQKSTSQTDSSSSSSIHTSSLSSTSPLSSETTPATISELPSNVQIHSSSSTKTSPISSLFSNSIPEITPGPTISSSSAIISSILGESTNSAAHSISESTSQVISTETHISSGQTENTPSPSPSNPKTQVISNGSLTSSIQPEITPHSSESSVPGTISSSIISEAVPKSTSTELLTSSTEPEIAPSPFNPLSSEAVSPSPISEPLPQSISTSSLTSSIQPEITPAPSSPSTSEVNPPTSETEFTSQSISTGSLTSSIEPEITPSPSPLETSEPSEPVETSEPVESPDPIETSQPETTESNPTETAIASSTSIPLSTSIASSAACTATTGGNCSTCYQYSGSSDISPSLSNSTTLESRKLPPSIAGRISTTKLYPEVSKRAAGSFTSFDAASSCVFGSVDVPSIPDASTLVSKAGTQTEYWYVLQDNSVNATTCPALGFTKVTDAALASQLINSNAVGYTKAGSGISWKANAPNDSTILQSFFASRVNSSNCAAFMAIFDQPDTVNAGKSRLQTIWNALPSDTNPDYAGIDQKISTVKAQAFTGELQQSYTSNDEKLSYISELAVAIAITNNDTIANLFQSTNLRIYKALLAIDTVIGADAVIGATNSTTTNGIKADWASTYRTYLTSLLTTRSSTILSQVSSYLDNDLGPAARNDNVTLSDGTISTTENSIGKGVDALLNAYPLATAFTFNQAKLLGFPSV